MRGQERGCAWRRATTRMKSEVLFSSVTFPCRKKGRRQAFRRTKSKKMRVTRAAFSSPESKKTKLGPAIVIVPISYFRNPGVSLHPCRLVLVVWFGSHFPVDQSPEKVPGRQSKLLAANNFDLRMGPYARLKKALLSCQIYLQSERLTRLQGAFSDRFCDSLIFVSWI